MQTAALTELAKIGAATEFTSQNATTQWADQILPRFETLIRAAPDELVDGLVGLRNAVLQDLQYRAANLPSTVYYDLKSAASSLFLSQRIYGNPDRADEIFARSGATHPLTISPGMIEVILYSASPFVSTPTRAKQPAIPQTGLIYG